MMSFILGEVGGLNMLHKACLYCGENFLTNRDYQKFCKSDCRLKSKNKPKRRVRCQICNKLFKWENRRKRPLRKHCCAECYDEMKLLDILLEFNVSDETMFEFGFERVNDGQTN